MVREDHFKGAHALTERMRNLYGVSVGCKMTYDQRLSCWQDPREAPVDCQSSPAPPILGMEMAELDCGFLVPRHLGRWITFSDVPCRWRHESSSTARRTFPARLSGYQGPSWRDFCPCVRWVNWGWGWGLGLGVGDRNINGVVYRDILGDTLVPFARQHFRDNLRYQMTMLRLNVPG